MIQIITELWDFFFNKKRFFPGNKYNAKISHTELRIQTIRIMTNNTIC